MTTQPTTALAAAIVKTLAYFDVFGYPLTSAEVWRYLYWPGGAPVSLGDMDTCMSEHCPVGVYQHQGFYSLSPQVARQVERRQERVVIAEQKFRRVRRVGHILALLPFVRSIAVCNSLSYGNAAADSDSDLFIIAAPGRVWTVRFFCLTFLALAGLRPRPGQRNPNAFCLSFFVDTAHANLQPLSLPRDDVHFVYWLEQFFPVYDSGGTYTQFLQDNAWRTTFLPNATGATLQGRRTITLGPFGRLLKRVGEWLVSSPRWEEWLGGWQFSHLPAPLRQKVNRDHGVMIRTGIIKLISNDRCEGYRNEWIIKSQQAIAALRRPDHL